MSLRTAILAVDWVPAIDGVSGEIPLLMHLKVGRTMRKAGCRVDSGLISVSVNLHHERTGRRVLGLGQGIAVGRFVVCTERLEQKHEDRKVLQDSDDITNW